MHSYPARDVSLNVLLDTSRPPENDLDGHLANTNTNLSEIFEVLNKM